MTENSSKEISIAGTLSYADFKKYNSYHRRKIVIGYFAFAFLAFFYILSNGITSNGVSVYPLAAILSFVASATLTLILILLLGIRIRREFKSDQIIKNEISYVINNEGINQKIRRSNLFIDWSDLLVAKEDHDMFRLYISKNKAMILTKRFFNSTEEINTLKTLIKNNLNSKKVKLK
ncbi:YcxB family protein [Saliterribacillus persicus]|uniref:YcxB-like protein n=1 Tax=Saliterribacillus persicus TaxID=930114 RepID=A0A368XGI3_9BACI|nr:YcxB family protein [Saliterribacillus persicus]RCW66945.1 YcxB-like protein [Saliterribacillus persicus]